MSSDPKARYRPDQPDSDSVKFQTPSPTPEPSAAAAGPRSKDPRSGTRCAKYNIFSRLFYCWLEPLFWYGACNNLKQSDLHVHPSEADSRRLNQQFNLYWKQELERKALGKKARLWMVFAKSFMWRYILQGILAFIEVAMLVGQSVLLGVVVDYFTEVGTEQQLECLEIPPSSNSRDAYLAAFGLTMLALLVAMIHAHYALIATKIGMMARIMTTSAVYNKMLLLSQTTINELTTGHVINVVSNDVQRFDLAFLFLPYMWIAPVHIAVFTYLVYLEVGWVVFVTLFFFIIQIPVQLVLAKIFTKFRFKSAAKTDQRVVVMNEVITGIRVIKMYAWEYAFKRVVNALRKHEIHLIKIGGMIRTLTASFNFGVALNLFTAITFLTFVGTGGELTPRRVIVTLSLLTFLRNISASFLIRSVFLLFEAKVAVERIEHILMQEELSPDEILAIGQEKGRIKLEESIKKEGFFRPKSPALSGLRKIEIEPTVELTSVVNFSKDQPTSTQPPSTPPPEVTFTPHPVDLDSLPVEVTAPVMAAMQNSVKVTRLSASWTYDEEKLTLQDLSFEVNDRSSFLSVVGKVGCGKSSLLQCVLGELKPLKGTVSVEGHVSYASQTPWVFSGTVKDNILFGSPLNMERYDKVIEACALRQDFDELCDGDLTLVGERGVTLSGGQKARVNLARAVYHEADVYLLDDPLSAVDTGVGKQIFEKCIRGLLLKSQVILVTHQVQFAVRADQILVLSSQGEVQMYHSREDLMEKGIDHHQLLKLLKEKGAQYVYDDVNDDDDDCDEGEEEEEEEEEDEEMDHFPGYPGPLMRQSSSTHPGPPMRQNSSGPPMRQNSSTYRSILLHRGESIDPLEESITSFGRRRYTSNSKDDVLLSSITPAYLGGEASLFSAPSQESLNGKEEVDDPDGVSEDKAQGTISIKTYINFFRAGAHYLVLFFVFLLFIIAEAGVVTSDLWLSEWSTCITNIQNDTNRQILSICNASDKSICSLNQDALMGIYGGITLTSILLNFVRTALFYLICINASRVLHNRMFQAIIRAPVRFFDTNPSGRVLNRFAKDTGFLDDLLPHTFLEYLFLLVRFLAVLVVGTYANYYVPIPAAFIVVGFIMIRWYFLKTSRDIKRLEAIARSPVYSHFSNTLQGLSTIRTLGRQEITQELFHQYQNRHTQGWYLYLATSRWFGMRIDIISGLYLGVIAFISIPLAGTLDAGVIGLGLAYTIALAGILQFCVRQSAEVENIMTSTERIMSYSNVEPELSLETIPPKQPPPDDWPQKGGLEMNGVRFRYDPTLPWVIRNLSFSVKATEKVGIVGRTGAGKSSLISVLFRLAEPEGNIEIDAVHTKSIGLHELRKKISIIPQDPVLFSGEMRHNLDPIGQYTDEDLWRVLEQVQLKSVVEQMPGKLSGEVSEGGSNFSVGEKQLVCLARALLKENKILILDEATANVDPGTDEIIQETIRKNFKHCTVLTIAHRLNTIMDSDKIMVMNHGQVEEFDTPYNLLKIKSSLFYKMVDKTGPEASKELCNMVKTP